MADKAVRVFLPISPSRGSLSTDSGAQVGSLAGTDDRRALRIQIGGTTENCDRDAAEGTNSFHQVYQTQMPSRHETPYYYSGQQPSLDQSTAPSGLTVYTVFIYLDRSANLPKGLNILTSVISFFL